MTTYQPQVDYEFSIEGNDYEDVLERAKAEADRFYGDTVYMMHTIQCEPASIFITDAKIVAKVSTEAMPRVTRGGGA